MGVGVAVLAWLAAATVLPAPEETPAYDVAGRRDPFVNSLSPSLTPRSGGGRSHCPVGLPGYAVAEITLKGTVQTKGEYVAMLLAPDGKTYTARAGQPFYDGRIVSISDGRATVQMAPDPKDPPGASGASGRIIQLTLAQ